MSITATIILPTTDNRGALLPFSVGAVQRQTISDFELFIIGDGVSEETRTIIYQLMQQDNRIHFVDQPKHPRRGEVYRHQVLQQAKGRIVAYLCDRDLWLPNHLATLACCLQQANLVTTGLYSVQEDDRLFIPFRPMRPAGISFSTLSTVGHTLDFYHQLPYGWRTTPPSIPTDVYMWQQMLAQPNCRPFTNWLPTVLYFKRGDHPGWTVAQRHPELSRWFGRLQSPHTLQPALDNALSQVIYDRNRLRIKWISLRGKSLNQLPNWFSQKIRYWLNPLLKPVTEETDWPAPIESVH